MISMLIKFHIAYWETSIFCKNWEVNILYKT